MAKRGKLQQEHFNYFLDLMQQIEWDLHHAVLDEKRIPKEWHEIAKARGRPEKIRLTLRVEADVVRFFRRFGRGYQERMNDVLSTWMHGRLAALIEGPDSADIAAAIDTGFGRRRIGELDLLDRGQVYGEDGTLRDVETGEKVE